MEPLAALLPPALRFALDVLELEEPAAEPEDEPRMTVVVWPEGLVVLILVEAEPELDTRLFTVVREEPPVPEAASLLLPLDVLDAVPAELLELLPAAEVLPVPEVAAPRASPVE